MNIHPSMIGFDIDGVVADTVEAFISLAKNDYGIDSISPHDITDFMVEECLDMDVAIVTEIFDRLMEEPIACALKPMANSMEILHSFAQVAPLTFITARPDKAPIAAWLEKHLGGTIYKKVRLVATGEHDGKAAFIKEMALKYFVDDRVETCVKLDREGIIPIVYNQPWNQGKHNLPSIENWLAIRDLCGTNY